MKHKGMRTDAPSKKYPEKVPRTQAECPHKARLVDELLRTPDLDSYSKQSLSTWQEARNQQPVDEDQEVWIPRPTGRKRLRRAEKK